MKLALKESGTLGATAKSLRGLLGAALVGAIGCGDEVGVANTAAPLCLGVQHNVIHNPTPIGTNARVVVNTIRPDLFTNVELTDVSGCTGLAAETCTRLTDTRRVVSRGVPVNSSGGAVHTITLTPASVEGRGVIISGAYYGEGDHGTFRCRNEFFIAFAGR